MYVYEIGNKVRIRTPHDEYWNDKIGTVTSVSSLGVSYFVEIDDSNDKNWFTQDRLVPADIAATAEPTSALNVGDKVQLEWEGHELHGREATVTEVRDSIVGILFDGFDHDRWYDRARIVPISAVEQQSPDDIIADLTQQLYEASKDVDEMRQRWNTIMNAYSHDMSHWEAVLREAKDEHGWCDEGSNEVIEKLNSEFIGGWYIDPYEQEFEVELDVTVTINTRVTVNVTASTLERAEDEAKYNYESYIDIAELIENEAEYANVEVDLY